MSARLVTQMIARKALIAYCTGFTGINRSKQLYSSRICRALSSSANDDEKPSSSLHFSSSGSKPRRTDPTTKRPNQKCDPYGQGGKPMSKLEANHFKSTVSEKWKFEYLNDESSQPIAISRDFYHPDYISGAKFVHKVAAVAQVGAHHFPCTVSLDRRIVNKEWKVATHVKCHTTVLNGLSANDFHLAMLIDVEANRPEVQAILLSPDQV